MARGPIFNPVERATGYSQRRQAERKQRLAATRARIRAAADDGSNMFGEDDAEALVDLLPEADQDFLGRTFYVNTGNELEQNRVIQLQRNNSGGFSWKDLLNDEGEWNAPYLGQWGGPGSGDGGFLDGIRGIVVRPDTGDVYVSSGTGASSKIQKFTANGTHISTIATYGTGNGQVDTPWGLAVDMVGSDCHLFLVDSGNHRVQRFINDSYSAQVGTLGSGSTNLDAPRGITARNAGAPAFPQNMRLLVADTGNDRLQQVNVTSGGMSIVNDFGTTGSGPGEFQSPTGLAHYSASQALVVDAGNNRIQLFEIDYSASVLATFQFSFGRLGASQGQVRTPDSVAIEPWGNIYVTDSGNHRVQVYDRAGIFRGMWGEFGSGDGQFDTPTAIAITNDYIYVCDSGNFRIQIFQNPLFGVSFIVGEVTTTWDPPSLGVGASTRLSGVLVPGALPGDLVEVSHNNVGTLTVLFTGNVTTANSVDVYAFNVNATTAQNVPSGTVRVRVTR